MIERSVAKWIDVQYKTSLENDTWYQARFEKYDVLALYVLIGN